MPKLVKTVSAQPSVLKPVKQKEAEIEAIVKKDDPPVVEAKPVKPKRVLSDEQKKVLRERLVKAREVRAEKRAASKNVE